jgi:hypothetical protein
VLPAVRSLPRRDAGARTALGEVARPTRPLVLARERCLPVEGALGTLFPAAGLQRGTVVEVVGGVGSGATSITFELIAAATRAGEWAAMIDDGTLGGLAAGESGIALDRLGVIRDVPAARWATVVGALLEGLSVVATMIPRHVRVTDARRLVARARERGAVLVAVGPWPVEAALRLRAEGMCWRAPAAGSGVLGPGVLGDRTCRVSVSGRGVVPRAPVEVLARAG